MKRIVILGCENSHADSFLKFIKEREEFSDVEVVGIYSDEKEAARRLSDLFGVPVLDNYADAVGRVDGVVITARHGDNHYKYAKPYIESGVPMFIDKPITVSEEEAILFMQQLKANGVRVCGGSSLKQADLVRQLRRDAEELKGGDSVGGYIRAPYNRENNYGGFYFYTQHLVEMVCEIFGRFPKSVSAWERGDYLHVVFHYDGFDCIGLYTDRGGLYYATRMTREGVTGGVIELVEDVFVREFREFYGLLSGDEGAPYGEFIAPVFILNAIERAVKSGKDEPVRRVAI